MDHSVAKLLYSRRDTAEAISLSIRSVDYLITTGRLSTRRIGGKILAHVFAVVIDVPLNRFLGDDLKPNAFVFHVHWKVYASQCIRLSNFIQLDRVSSAPTFSRRSRPSM